MKSPSHTDFRLASCLAAAVTPDSESTVAGLMTDLVPRWSRLFDAEPRLVPSPEGRRIQLVSKSGVRRCEITAGRIDLLWIAAAPDTVMPSLESFYLESAAMLDEYAAARGARLGRLAAVVNRFCFHEQPSAILAHHFLRDRWHERSAAFDDLESFDVGAHRRLVLEGVAVNCWIRSRAGVTPTGARNDVLLVEQDVNTLAEEIATRQFTPKQVTDLLRGAAHEIDRTLERCYPKTDPA